MELYFVDDTFGGHIVYIDHVEPTDPVFFQQCVRQTAIQYLEEDAWRLMYVDGLIDFHRRQMDLIHYSALERLSFTRWVGYQGIRPLT